MSDHCIYILYICIIIAIYDVQNKSLHYILTFEFLFVLIKYATDDDMAKKKTRCDLQKRTNINLQLVTLVMCPHRFSINGVFETFKLN